MKNKITPPDLIGIKGKGIKVVAALQADDLSFSSAREQKYNPREIRLERIPGMGAVYVRWLLKGKGPYTVEVRSVKGGSNRRQTKP